MKRNNCITLAFLFVALMFPLLAHAQHGQLYSGLLEKGYPKNQYANTPYYPQEFQKGRVTYHGFTYEDVALKADLATGQLIILSPATGYSLTYSPEDMERIELDGRALLYQENPAVGWYEVICTGKDWTLCCYHYVSNAIQEAKGPAMVTRYSLGQKIYLQKHGSWVVINNLNAFCKHFKERKSELQTFARQQSLKLNAQDFKGWKLMGDYLNTL